MTFLVRLPPQSRNRTNVLLVASKDKAQLGRELPPKPWVGKVHGATGSMDFPPHSGGPQAPRRQVGVGVGIPNVIFL